MTVLTNQPINRPGLTPAFAAVTASDSFVPSNRTFYYAKVGSTATTFTFVVPTGKGSDYSGMALGNLIVGPITSADRIIGPFPADIFADPVTGLITVQASQVTGVTAGAFDLTN